MAAVRVEPVDTVGLPDGGRKNRRRRPVQRSGRTPYLLIVPTLVVIAITLGVPLYKIITQSFRHQTKFELYHDQPGSWVGFQNFSDVMSNNDFWSVVERTIVVTVVLVVLSIGISLGLALLLNRVSRWVRMPMMVLLMFIWAIPQIVSIELFNWFVDPNFGVLNYMLKKVGFSSFDKHDWFVDPVQGWSVIIALVIWGAIPFLTITLSAGMSMVPKELGEAAKMDGASPIQAFKAVTYPILKPLLVIVTSLSVIWDFQLFNQAFVIRQNKPEPDYQVLGIYSYTQAFGHSDYGLGSAISVLTVLAMLGMMVFYVRQMLRIGDGD
jgi:N,N'-diacetylchitobiose transport system permease protein